MTYDIRFLPPEIQGPSAWYGPALLRHTDWAYHLSDTEAIEIEAAVIGLGCLQLCTKAIYVGYASQVRGITDSRRTPRQM